jgi:probable rRNA maturation factor
MPDEDQPPGLQLAITDESGRPARAPGLAAWLRRVAPARARGEVSVALVPDRVIRRLNREYAGIDRATDVLSFPAAPLPAASPAPAGLGDVVIATGVARRQARDAGHSYATELRVLALHGLLHLLGYDHHDDGGRMARVETRLRRKGGLPAGVIERARGL